MMPRLRPMQFEDYAGVQAVLTRNGLSGETPVEWRNLWTGNPAWQEHKDLPLGWVLETVSGAIVGVGHCVPAIYWLNGRKLLAAVGRGGAVDREFRADSVAIFQAFFEQARPDLLINTSANPVAGKLWQAFGAQPVPHATYDEVLLWVTNYPQVIASAAYQRWGRKQDSWAWATGRLVQCWHYVNRRCRMQRASAEVIRLVGFDERFDHLLEQLRVVPDKLHAARDRDTLTWHFSRAEAHGTLVVLLAVNHGVPVGYLVAVREDRLALRITRYSVADLQTLPDQRPAVGSLLSRMVRIARQEGVGVVEVTGLAAEKRRWLEELRPLRRRLSTWPFYFRCRRQDLSEPRLWDPTLYDGDSSIGAGAVANVT